MGGWIAYRVPQPAPRMNLFCLHHAGGSASLFRGWQDSFDAAIELSPIQLPGRQSRLSEPLARQMAPLASALVDALRPMLSRPYALFGHSMGGFIGFELARRLSAAGHAPVALIVSAAPAPDIRDGRIDHLVDDAQLSNTLASLGGTPDEVFEHEELMEIILPIFRADLELCETYAPPMAPPVPCDIIAIGGKADTRVTATQLTAWAPYTSGRFEQHELDGDHAYLEQNWAAIAALIQERLLPHVTQGRGDHAGSR